MAKIQVLLMYGGGGAEHDVSKMSAAFVEQSLSMLADINVLCVELTPEGHYKNAQGVVCQFDPFSKSQLIFHSQLLPPWPVDFVIPCFHGYPGETGDIQSLLDMMSIPYLGCGAEASTVCFNKVSTKLWLTALEIPHTPYLTLSTLSSEQVDRACEALAQWQQVFVKASSQGSSVGCYQVSDEATLKQRLVDAFAYSPYVIVEQSVSGRELEVAVYKYNDDIVASVPGEIHSPEGSFYTYDEKYANDSDSTTDVVANNILPDQIAMIKRYAIEAFVGLKLRHLSRIDFFLTDTGDILLNEVNTFPGMTPISMFPKMMINHGHLFSVFLQKIIHDAVKANH